MNSWFRTSIQQLPELAQVTAEGVATQRDTDDSVSSINLNIQDRTPRGDHGEDGKLETSHF